VDLQHHTCLNHRNRATGRPSTHVFSINDQVERYTVSGGVVFDDAGAILRSAVSGLGVSQMDFF